MKFFPGASGIGNTDERRVSGSKLTIGALPLFIMISVLFFPVFNTLSMAGSKDFSLDLGLTSKYYIEKARPKEWKLRKRFGLPKGAHAEWVIEEGVHAIRLHSEGALTFLEKPVNISIKEYPIVTWRWKVENILEGVDEKTIEGDDHPIRIFFVFEPDKSKQSLWFRMKRFIYLDRVHGHPFGGRFTEYLWSSHHQPGDVIKDPGKPWQKLMVIEGGTHNLGKWMSYKMNLYEDYKKLYGEEPRRLIFIGILNDTDQTGQEAVSYIADLMFHKRNPDVSSP
jgi:hypothetical protein